jgi:hypothetical protein
MSLQRSGLYNSFLLILLSVLLLTLTVIFYSRPGAVGSRERLTLSSPHYHDEGGSVPELVHCGFAYQPDLHEVGEWRAGEHL